MELHPFHNFLRELHAAVKAQEQKLHRLEQHIVELRSQITELKQQKTISVGRIEYKFDQLKVETLEGTLQIGLTPNDTQAIEDLSIQQASNRSMTEKYILFSTVRKKLSHFMENELPTHLKQLEQRYRIILGGDFRHTMIQDLNSQMDQRIVHYMETITEGYGNELKEEGNIVSAVEKDILRSLEQFIQNHFGKEPMG